jgi:hypothetical protein
VSLANASAADGALCDLERSLLAATIVVTTRLHRLTPPLREVVRVQLNQLDRSQRNEYLDLALKESAHDLRVKLDSNRTLDSITRTPLILAEVGHLFSAGMEIPPTKMGVLAAVLDGIEKSVDHPTALKQAPLRGHASPAAFKMRIVDAHLPPFLEFIAAGTNYALSFIVLQHLHLALATKQPSVTAATFAGIVRSSSGKERLDRVAEFVSRITRSQLASAAGNLLAVFLGCFVFAHLWAWYFSRPYLDIPSAEYVYQTLDPIASGTAIYAALTGLILWISAFAGGWFENFAAFNHIPEAISQHPLGKVLGVERMNKLARFVHATRASRSIPYRPTVFTRRWKWEVLSGLGKYLDPPFKPKGVGSIPLPLN